MGAELFHVAGRTDKQTDMTKLKVAFFCSFANSPQKHTCLNSKEKKTLRIYVLRNHALYSAGQIFFFLHQLRKFVGKNFSNLNSYLFSI